jgi:hypothetical protein
VHLNVPVGKFGLLAQLFHLRSITAARGLDEVLTVETVLTSAHLAVHVARLGLLLVSTNAYHFFPFGANVNFLVRFLGKDE